MNLVLQSMRFMWGASYQLTVHGSLMHAIMAAPRLQLGAWCLFHDPGAIEADSGDRAPAWHSAGKGE